MKTHYARAFNRYPLHDVTGCGKVLACEHTTTFPPEVSCKTCLHFLKKGLPPGKYDAVIEKVRKRRNKDQLMITFKILSKPKTGIPDKFIIPDMNTDDLVGKEVKLNYKR